MQYAYQIFFTIDKNGLSGGIHKGHNLTKQDYANQDIPFNNWDDYLQQTKDNKEQWTKLNSEVNFLFINDEKAFVKAVNKTDATTLSNYFKILDNLKDDLNIQDEEKYVFSVSRNMLSFQVGKRYCLNVNKHLFGFITYNELLDNSNDRETFSGPDMAYFYKNKLVQDVFNNYEDIKSAIETEIERENHALAKAYDNSAFRKAVFDKKYRQKFIDGNLSSERIVLNGQKIFKISMGKDYFNNEAIEQAIEKGLVLVYSQTKPKGRSTTSQADIFTMKMKIGDYFYLTHSNENIKLIGKVTTKSELASFKDLSNKGWLERGFETIALSKKKGSYAGIGKYWAPNTNVTCWQINENEIDEANNVLFKPFFDVEFINKENRVEQSDTNNEIMNNYSAPLNQIFYGPPGTGKTYNTILEAAKIITQEENISYNDAQMAFNNHLGERIEFITFHQNYSYEDFIQGLRPDIEQKSLSFNRTDGIFTKMVTNALFEYYKVYQKNQIQEINSTEVQIDLNDAYIEFIGSLKENQEFETKTGKKIEITNFTDKQNIEFKPLEGVKSYLVSGTRLLKLYKVFPKIEDIERVHEDIRDAIGGCNSSIYYVALREFITFLEKYKESVEEFVDEEVEYDYEDISYRRKKELLSNFALEDLRKVSENEVPKYVIIIDEINRANISRVFGELITLIEKDKRSHGNIPLSATLPSGESFIVPSNLNLIGTMNTADKSIALLDIALRRRFEFVPMYPDYNSTEDKVINDANILEAINKEIISRKGHDFTIGHSHFMGEDYGLKNTINNKVIPLLLEYFMNDFEEVKKILSAANISVDGWPMQYITND